MKTALRWISVLCFLPFYTANAASSSTSVDTLNFLLSKEYPSKEDAETIKNLCDNLFNQWIKDEDYKKLNNNLPVLKKKGKIYSDRLRKLGKRINGVGSENNGADPGSPILEFERDDVCLDTIRSLSEYFDKRFLDFSKKVPIECRNLDAFTLKLLAMAANDVYDLPNYFRSIAEAYKKANVKYNGGSMETYKILNKYCDGSHSYKTMRYLGDIGFECIDFSYHKGSLVVRLYRNIRYNIGVIAVRGTDNLENMKANMAIGMSSVKRGDNVIPEHFNKIFSSNSMYDNLLKIATLGVLCFGYANYGSGFETELKEYRVWAKEVIKNSRYKSFLDGVEEIYVTGHSLGGYLAQIIAVEGNVNGVSFNAPYLEGTYLKNSTKLTEFNKNFFHYRIIGDFVSRVGEESSTGTEKHLGPTHFYHYEWGEDLQEKHSMEAFLSILDSPELAAS